MRGHGGGCWLRVLRLVLLLLLGLGAHRAQAGGPRFYSGQGWGVAPGTPVGWGGTVLRYFTDPGSLSAGVSHAQADAMVAAAAAVWAVPTSSIAYAQGGVLAEHVDTSNTYFNGTQLVFPADVQTANEPNVPVAVIYDATGELIDLLLGEGASEPDGCGQNAVVGDVDDIHTNDGQIHHAVLLLNGRCVGTAAEQLTQMQYQLARAFGRVLGLSWSQTNDNVFTAQTTVTLNQMNFWPLMHPIDVICGAYSYQCMLNPFTLRADDLNSLAQLYLVPANAVPVGKVATSVDSLWLVGLTLFPTGQGMEWENVTTWRQHNGANEDWQTTSSATGGIYLQAGATPVNGTPAVNSGRSDSSLDGFYSFRRIPLDGLSNVFFVSEPINPLYMGEAALGPYVRPPAAPSGSPTTVVAWSAYSLGNDFQSSLSMVAGDAASSCTPGADGTEAAPASPDPSGWQMGLLCGWGHNSWWNVPVAAGHSWTLEVTATDETGAASVNKVEPVVGLWNASDATGTMPTVASQAVAFNSMSLGMTQVQMPAGIADNAFRVSVSDQYGAGRPDFTYTARVLYAASSTPATVGSGGGQIVITGTGFRQGNQVLVNGAAARVLSWSATQIVADAPPMALAGTQVGVPVTITVADASTGGSATIPLGVSYTAEPNVMQLVSAPATLETGLVAAVAFKMRVLASDGLSPVVNEAVGFAVTSGSAALGMCGDAMSCTGITDADGYVQTSVAGQFPGSVTLQATDLGGTASVQVDLQDTEPVRAASFANPVHYVAAGVSDAWQLGLSVLQDSQPAAGVGVTWSGSAGVLPGSPGAATNAAGVAVGTVSTAGLAAGTTGSLTGCAWGTVCATWTVYGVDPSQWVLAPESGGAQSVPQGTGFSPVGVSVSDGGGHPVEGALVQVYQRVLAWEGVCATGVRCPAAPVLATSQTTTTSDGSGAIAIAPLQVDGVPQVLEIAISTGTQGFLTMTLVKTP